MHKHALNLLLYLILLSCAIQFTYSGFQIRQQKKISVKDEERDQTVYKEYRYKDFRLSIRPPVCPSHFLMGILWSQRIYQFNN